MDETRLDKKALAEAKLEAKRTRIVEIRKTIAVLAVSLVGGFSAVVIGLNGIPLLFGSGSQEPTTEVVQADGIEQQIGATVTALASGLVLGDDDDDDDDEGGFLGIGGSRSGESPGATTSQS